MRPVGDGWDEPLDAARLRDQLERQGRGAKVGSMWTDLRVVAETGSTNEDVSKLAADGAPEGVVLATEWQTAGRGRQGRAWQTGPTGALTFSVLLRPAPVPQQARGWVPLIAGVAAATAVRLVTGVDAWLKWPNDLLAGGRKLAGILAEQCGDAIVVGTGINVLANGAQVPAATATSLQESGAGPSDRNFLLAEILRQLERRYQAWRATGPGDAVASGLREEYLALCATVGRAVSVQLPGDRLLTGTATGVDGAGQLLVSPGPAAADVAVSAGDVIHVR